MNKKQVKIGAKYECLPRKSEKICFSFTGYVEEKYDKSVMVRVVSSHELDDEEMSDRKWRTVWPYEYMKKMKE